ncbi:CDP-glycerol glycerophosphotransferase family protein [Pseudarthrobacter sp. 1C304]|uniref:CDP-glycerol glycerophosphotransferase family protein n=1 Tax=Pseudarthrobacter sp. 1C304 TaxID=3457438 RepID=UPI003FD29513
MSSPHETIEHGLLLEEQKDWTAAVGLYTSLLDSGNGDNAELAYRIGHAHFHLRQWAAAEDFLRQATDWNPRVAPWHYRLGFVQEQLGLFSEAADSYTAALDLEPHRARWQHKLRAARAAADLADPEGSRTRLQHGNPAYHSDKLERLRENKAPLWQQLEVLAAGKEAHEANVDWTVQLAAAQYGMKRFSDAAESYAAANTRRPGNADWYFQAGHAYELSGDAREAEQCYAQAILHDKSLKSDVVGIGAFFQKKGAWPDALAHYQEKLRREPANAQVAYRVGLAFDRCYRWADAAEAYEYAVVLSPDVPYWHYKLGLARERSLRWSDAAEAYGHAWRLDNSKRYWAYRAGYALETAGQAQKACDYYLASTNYPQPGATADGPSGAAGKDRGYLQDVLSRRLGALASVQSSEVMQRVGDLAAQLGDWDTAEAAFADVVSRSNDFDPRQFYQLGVARHRAGAFTAACDAFRQMRLFKASDGIDVESYLKNKAQKTSLEYVEYYESLPLEPHTILWESNHGASIGCHPLALFDEVCSDPRFQDFNHYWAINNQDNIPDRLRGRKNVRFVRTNSDLYKRVLSSAEHLVNNVSFPPYFVRKDGQKYLNTWHGTPLKTLGRDMAGGPVAHANIARNFLQSTHIMSPNKHTTQALIQRHDIEGLFQGKVAVTGSPRIDGLVNAGSAKRRDLRSRLGIAPDDHRPVVLYAPTWRGASDDRHVDAVRLQEDLNAMRGADHHVFFRAHRLTEGLLSGFDAGTAIVPGDIDTNDLLAAVDLLITDYSSIFFDFLPTGRPIVFYAFDLDDYAENRGLYFDMQEMPGTVVQERSGLTASIRSSLASDPASDPRYLSAKEQFCPQEDGRSAARVVRFFFGDDPDELADEPADAKSTLLFHHGLLPNGIATSFRNLVASLDTSRFRAVLVVEPAVLAADPARLAKLRELPDHVQIIGRTGVQSHTPEERWISRKLTATLDLASDAQWSIYRSSFKREFRRIFGDSVFDSVIEFDGYAPFWTSLIAFSPEGPHRSIYMHNDMANEKQMKFPVLEIIFRLYADFDALISVASGVADKNRRLLAGPYELDREAFTHCDNQIDPGRVLSGATEALDADISEWYDAGRQNFVTIGRLSPEKDHRKLIRAFVRFHSSNPGARLMIIGDGPLRYELEKLIQNQKASGYIWLAGQRQNPYPALKHADCFVLSSLHEGQPMVLFEAMILGLSIICTDMPGPRDVLQDRYGLIVENSEDGVLAGLAAAVGGTIPTERFGTSQYVQSALDQFLARNLSGRAVSP